MEDPDPLKTSAWLRARRTLGIELGLLVAAGAALFGMAPIAEGALSDTRFLYLAALALFSVLLLDAVRRMLEILDWECPRCRENFCGPLLFRARCSYCGQRPDPEAAPRASSDHRH